MYLQVFGSELKQVFNWTVLVHWFLLCGLGWGLGRGRRVRERVEV